LWYFYFFFTGKNKKVIVLQSWAIFFGAP